MSKKRPPHTRSDGTRDLNKIPSAPLKKRVEQDRAPICPPCLPDVPHQVWDQHESCFVIVINCLSCGNIMDAKEI